MKFLVFTSPHPGRDQEFNTWYDDVHIPDLLQIPGLASCTRHRMRTVAGISDDLEYLAIYEIDGDPEKVMAEFVARTADGRLRPGDAIDSARTRLSFWE